MSQKSSYGMKLIQKAYKKAYFFLPIKVWNCVLHFSVEVENGFLSGTKENFPLTVIIYDMDMVLWIRHGVSHWNHWIKFYYLTIIILLIFIFISNVFYIMTSSFKYDVKIKCYFRFSLKLPIRNIRESIYIIFYIFFSILTFVYETFSIIKHFSH